MTGGSGATATPGRRGSLLPVSSVAVLIPVLNRPERVEPLLESLNGCRSIIPIFPCFLCSPDDEAEIEAVTRSGVPPVVMSFPPGPGDYARKMNFGFDYTPDEFVFLAADDLRFWPGWIEHAIGTHLQTGACVVGTNDLGNPSVTAGRHSTHTLVHRNYRECGTIDDPEGGKILHEGYHHNWVDTEFIATAEHRGTYAHAHDAVVEHLHPFWGKATDDATYKLGRDTYHTDGALFKIRSRLWAT